MYEFNDSPIIPYVKPLSLAEIKYATMSKSMKLFDTIDEMQKDSDAKESDLAVVYGSKIQNWDGNGYITGAFFPNTVTLPKIFDGDGNVALRSRERNV